METVFDITNDIQKVYDETVLKAEAKGKNVLVLIKLPKKIRLTPKSKLMSYRLEYRWLSKPIQSAQDVKQQNFVCVAGNEFTYYTRNEIEGFQKYSLFDIFHLF